MTDSKRTPGPWIVESREWTGILPSKYLIWAWEADRQLVASMVTREADARLIAAAPDLLEALEAFIAAWNMDISSKQENAVCRAFDLARIAITKANEPMCPEIGNLYTVKGK